MSALSERQKRWRLKHPDRARDAASLKRARVGGYAPPWQSEAEGPPRPADGCCELCRREVTGKWQRDHDHITGDFRGWLCVRCNSLLGMVESLGLERIRRYIRNMK